MLKLYTYFRSSASYRVRTALNLKDLAYEAVAVHLIRNGGEQHSAAFTALNPAALVPVLVDGDATLQSLAIIEYLEETHPEPALLPATAAGRARVRAIAQTTACEIHPIDNLRVLRYLELELGVDSLQHFCTQAQTFGNIVLSDRQIAENIPHRETSRRTLIQTDGL